MAKTNRLKPSPAKRVLIVEDDQIYETLLRRVLAEIEPGIQIDWLGSAEEARSHLEALARNHEKQYDLIIVDIFLEGDQTGYDLWNHCKDGRNPTPLLITSGLPIDKFLRAFGRNEVCPPFLAKPFMVGECRQILTNLLI